MINGEGKYVMNQEDAHPYFDERKKLPYVDETQNMNGPKRRNVNYFMIQTPKHQINFLCPLDIGINYVTSVQIFEREKGVGSAETVEVHIQEPDNYHSRMLFPIEGGMSLQMHHEKIVIWLVPIPPEDKQFDILTTELYISVPSIDFEFEG